MPETVTALAADPVRVRVRAVVPTLQPVLTWVVALAAERALVLVVATAVEMALASVLVVGAGLALA